MTINRKTRSILEEINSYIPNKNKQDVIESKANHIIMSAINLIESIDRTFEPEEAEALKKRFISSIRGSDPTRFSRMMVRVKSGNLTEEDDAA